MSRNPNPKILTLVCVLTFTLAGCKTIDETPITVDPETRSSPVTLSSEKMPSADFSKHTDTATENDVKTIMATGKREITGELREIRRSSSPIAPNTSTNIVVENQSPADTIKNVIKPGTKEKIATAVARAHEPVTDIKSIATEIHIPQAQNVPATAPVSGGRSIAIEENDKSPVTAVKRQALEAIVETAEKAKMAEIQVAKLTGTKVIDQTIDLSRKKDIGKVLPTAALSGQLKGKVSVTVNGKTFEPENIIITATPTDTSSGQRRPTRKHTIDMVGKNYQPKALLVQTGDTVVFKNLDPFRHNVFSLTGKNQFDLGTYGRGTEPEKVFEYPGLVKIYCNIHPSMVCFIMVSPNQWGTVTDKDGTYDISNLPTGEYSIEAWHVRGGATTQALIAAGETSVLNIEIDGSKFKKKPHLNKYGKKYPKNTSDEFY